MSEARTYSPHEAACHFVAHTPLHMTLMDLEGRVLQMSPAFIETFVAPSGFASETVIGARVYDLSPEVTSDIRDTLERLAGGEPVVKVEATVDALDGRRITFRSQASYWRDLDDRPIAILFILQDVSAEVQAQFAQRGLEGLLRAVVNNLPAEIALLNLETGVIELLNTRLINGSASLLGSSVGRPYQESLSGDLLANFEAHIARTEAAGGVFESELDVSHDQASGRRSRVKHIIFRDDRGQRHLLWIAEDVTALHETAKALQLAAAQAEAASRAKTEFLTNMSHEIRTPLNGIMGVAGALDRTPLSPPQREMVALIETSAKTLETLLSDILDLARIEAGKMELQPEPFDLAASVNACTALFDAAAQAKGLDLDVTIAPDALGAYVGDAARLRQILANLLGNAVKFTQAGRVRLAVTACASEKGAELRFDVHDTGPGFDAETKLRLFSRFEQADGSITRRFGGSGLGLSISRSLAEAMGGRLEAEAEPGRGATFSLIVELPRCEAAAAARADALPEAAADPLAGMRVLLAEDHPTNRRVVELILGAAGVELTCVENGLQAIEAFRAGTFELVLMDMQMPVMDGLTAIAEIRKLEAADALTPTPIHVLTANGMPEHVSASQAAGADGHLTKPILAQALLERVATAADRRTQRERIRGLA